MKTAVLLSSIALGASIAAPHAVLGQATPKTLTQPIVNAQAQAQEVNQVPAEERRDPRFTSRYGSSNAARPATPAPAATPARPPAAAPAAAPVAVAPVAPSAAPAAVAEDPRFTSRYGSSRPRTAAPAAAPVVAPAQVAVPQAGVAAVPAAPVATPVRARPADPDRVQRIVNFQKQNAISGNVTAQYDLGMRYVRGDGVEQDDSQAMEWLKLAAQNGHSRARKELDALHARVNAAPAAKAPAPSTATQ